MSMEALVADRRTLVLEGCDGVGKTTLARHLSAHHDFTVAHFPRTPDHLDLASRYRTALAQPGRIVFDRCFLSELVYGPLYRGRSRITWGEALDLAESVIARDGLFVHLTASPAVIHRRILRRAEERVEPEEVVALVAEYERVFATLADYVEVVTLDTTVTGLPSTG